MLWQPTRGILQPNQHWRRPQTPAAGGGDPSTIFGANLMAWYKADVGVSLSGSNITAVADQSGNGRNATFASAPGSPSMPTYSASGFNGGPGVVFGTSNDSLASAAFNIAASSATFWMTVNVPSLGGGRMLAYCDPTAGDYNQTAGILPGYQPSTTLTTYYSGTAQNASSFSGATNYRFIIVVDGGAGSITQYLDGSSVSTRSASISTLGTSLTQLIIGYDQLGTGTIMNVSEWGMAKAVPASVATLDSYLQTKWGL